MATKTDIAEDVTPSAALKLTEREFKLIRSLVYQKTGITLADNKLQMLSGRLIKRVRQLGLPSFHAYYQLVQQEGGQSDELRELINSVTTNKTFFFREKHHFEFLTAQLKQRPGPAPLRIWSAACSTGEEPYSIAMTVADALGTVQRHDIRILASDIDTEVLKKAQEGIYPAHILDEIPQTMQRRFLKREDSAGAPFYRVCPELRNIITFRQKNLIAPSWTINTTFDFIFCRNVLIYFDHATQDRILRKFISYLKPNAYLVIGHSEHVHWLNALIEPVGATIYRVRSEAAK